VNRRRPAGGRPGHHPGGRTHPSQEPLLPRVGATRPDALSSDASGVSPFPPTGCPRRHPHGEGTTVDDHLITPRRALPPVPPPGRQSGTATLAPAVDQTSWFDPLDPMNDSAVHAAFTGLDPLDDGTAAKAARDLIRESGRQPVLDQALLEALDAAAKAAEARRAVTLAVLPATATTPSVIAPRPAPPVMTAAPVPVTDRSDEPALDISAEFARHDDLVETARHAAMDDGSTSAPTPPPPATGTGRHLALDVDEDAAQRRHGGPGSHPGREHPGPRPRAHRPDGVHRVRAGGQQRADHLRRNSRAGEWSCIRHPTEPCSRTLPRRPCPQGNVRTPDR
ncbi:Hypothetical protein KLENKIAIHU_2722, partial [Klenkia terrae]